MRKALVVTLSTVALLLSASPAWAVSKSGTLYCPEIWQTEYARARAYGNLYLKGPGDSSYTYYNLGSSWGVRNNSGPGGYWRAYIGGLDNQGTYHWCSD